MKNKKTLMIIGIVVVGLVGLAYGVNKKFTNDEALKIEESLITKQSALEKEHLATKGYTVDKPNVVLDPYESSPLTALIMFETVFQEAPTVTIKGKDESTTYKHTFLEGREHYLSIYGLYPDTENEVLIEYGDVSETVIIKTDKLPDDFPLPTEVINNKEKLDNDLYFFTPSSKGYTSAYDVNGDVRWYLTYKATWDISRLDNGKLLLSTDRPIKDPYHTTGMYEIDLLGKVYKEFSIKGGYHHDFFEMKNGNLLVASNDLESEEGTVEDYIVELDRATGDIVKTWDLKDVMDMDDGKSENWSKNDWFHNNSVWYNERENLIILSGRHKDAVVAINYDTGFIAWILGDPTNWGDEYQRYFFTPVEGEEFEWQWSQHAAMVLPDNNIFLLDNGNNKSKNEDEYVEAKDSYTRGVIYNADKTDMSISQVWEYGKDRGSDFYSPYISDVDYIDENHYLIHSGGIVYVDGVNSNRPAGFDDDAELYSTTVELIDDEVVFEITLPTNMYRAEKMSLYNSVIFGQGEAVRLGSLGKTKSAVSIGLPSNPLDDHDYDFTITEEDDRLVFEGEFDEHSKVSVVLYDNFTMREYKVPNKDGTHQALCVNIFGNKEDAEQVEYVKYINKDGLVGKQSIYLKVNGVLYNTGKYMEKNYGVKDWILDKILV